MEYEWDDIEVDYPPHLLKQIEKFEEAYSQRQKEVTVLQFIYFFIIIIVGVFNM